MKKLAIIALSILTTLSGIAPSYAFPSVQTPTAQSSNLELVQHRGDWRDRDRRRDRDRWERRRDRDRWDRRDWRDSRRGYYRGHRGYRERRHGYHRHSDGFWYPLAAFGAGAIIGGALASPPPAPRYVAPARGISPAHVDWCSMRYRSYRSYDNTFQPYNGPRQQCVSPYL